ncbi:MAG TPA: hypothetical protein VGO93_16030 [Candidatus Xenobia bacterium]|jgi:hypothetical protein
MKRLQAVLALSAITVGLALTSRPASSVVSQPWSKANTLNIGGIHLGMPEVDARRAAAQYRTTTVPVSIRYDDRHRVSFVSGGDLRQGTRMLASWQDGSNKVREALGTPFLKAPLGIATVTFYPAGSHWVMFRFQTPNMFSRAAAFPEFGLAADAGSIPTAPGGDYWGATALMKALPQ